MTQPSSSDLHPKSGARFVFERDSASDVPAHYRVHVHLAGGDTWAGSLAWADGKAELVATGSQDVEREPWVRATALALARVLKRKPQQRLLRWRA